jgi:hypothetical protein
MTCTAYDPEYNRINKEELDKYLKEHPFPKDDAAGVEGRKQERSKYGVKRAKETK